ncbi:hypothetical protein K443DRAFT_10482 [Laccaria amethystina LaAM-08-1]|uniref:Uncharacterized protein n=1 Tax=Laccaria amethystina LaAM-08-1 TaxID=1095629 RepID=A0A0C9WKT2_9AGAR|nr:hypothetical protein K443DRAFT_10482 [Laccaria amethystina LaAM-08-1]
MSTAGPDCETRKASKPSEKLTDASNSGKFKLDLKSHQHIHNSAISTEASKTVSTTTSSKHKQATVKEVDDEESNPAPKVPPSKQSWVIASDGEIEEVSALTSLSNARHENEPLELEHSEPEAPTVLSKDKTKDVDVFFHPPVRIGRKPRRACILCKAKGFTQTIVSEAPWGSIRLP